MRKFHRVMSLVAVTFMASGIVLPISALASDDGRTARVLSAPERNAIPIEMRGFPKGVQGIVACLMAPTDTSRLAASLYKMDFR